MQQVLFKRSLHGDPMQNILLVMQFVAHLVAKVQAVLD